MAILNGMFDAPAKSTATAIEDFAVEIRNSARAALEGGASAARPQELTASGRDIAIFIVPVLAGIAALCGAVGLLRQEPKTLPLLAIGAGGTMVAVQFAIWLALLICGVLVIGRSLTAMDGIMGFRIFDGFGSERLSGDRFRSLSFLSDARGAREPNLLDAATITKIRLVGLGSCLSAGWGAHREFVNSSSVS